MMLDEFILFDTILQYADKDYSHKSLGFGLGVDLDLHPYSIWLRGS